MHYKLYDPSSNEVSLQDHEYLNDFPVGDSGTFVPSATYVLLLPTTRRRSDVAFAATGSRTPSSVSGPSAASATLPSLSPPRRTPT